MQVSFNLRPGCTDLAAPADGRSQPHSAFVSVGITTSSLICFSFSRKILNPRGT